LKSRKAKTQEAEEMHQKEEVDNAITMEKTKGSTKELLSLIMLEAIIMTWVAGNKKIPKKKLGLRKRLWPCTKK